MKKFTTKLLMSIIAVAFAFVALGTSTYAWFSMNTSVSVTGLQVTAKSESTYLVIGSSSELATLQDKTNGNKTTVAMTVSDNEAAVFPAAHDAVATLAEAENEGKWYYEVAEDPSATTAKAGTKTALTETDFSKYVIKKTVYVTLAKGSTDATNLVATAAFTAKTPAEGADEATIEPIRVLIVSSDNKVVELSNAENTSATALAATVTDDDVIQLDIYIYYYGAHEKVFTNNIINLNGAGIELSFAVTASSGN